MASGSGEMLTRVVWSSAFMIYASLMLEKFSNKGLEFFKYMHTVRMAPSRGYSLGWVNYD
jgi:hypothetical protein